MLKKRVSKSITYGFSKSNFFHLVPKKKSLVVAFMRQIREKEWLNKKKPFTKTQRAFPIKKLNFILKFIASEAVRRLPLTVRH